MNLPDRGGGFYWGGADLWDKNITGRITSLSPAESLEILLSEVSVCRDMCIC